MTAIFYAYTKPLLFSAPSTIPLTKLRLRTFYDNTFPQLYLLSYEDIFVIDIAQVWRNLTKGIF